MPPKRVVDSEEDSGEDMDTSTATMERTATSESHSTPRTTRPDALLVNNPNDEFYPVSDSRAVRTPSDAPQSSARLVSDPPPAPSPRPGPELKVLRNKPSDEYAPALDAQQLLTPRALSSKGAPVVGGVALENAPHDEMIAVWGSGTPVGTPKARQAATRMQPPEESTDEDEEREEDDDQESRNRGFSSQRPDAIVSEPVSTVIPNLEYKPQEYAKINATASVEMQELFKRITSYQPPIADIPAKLRPFIPDYIPSVGDLDPFCKVPRPDGRLDGLGIYVLDEPSVTQSNPAVVLLELRATNIHSSGGLAEVVDSFEDAANRPEVIDRWIADVKKVHYKKPLPTINYQKPMPEIETLLQVWPQGFEDFLNSDVQFPPSHIDMDLDQYVRTLCSILDIPTYSSLIDSLHVMFTLYQEFRANQHFQHE